MTNLEIGLYSIPILLTLLALRVPIAAALGIVAIGGLMAMRGLTPALSIVGSNPWDFSASWTLSAVPMFLFMGTLAYETGLTSGLFRAARIMLGRVPGGLAVSANVASAGFAAVSGSSMATTAAMGAIATPEMLKYKYDPGIATASVAASGTLGALIPPSIAFVIYGWYAEMPVSQLLVAGILPGLLTAGLYSAMIIGRCMRNPKLAPVSDQRHTAAEAWDALKDVWPVPALILGVVGGIYGGLATPTEAGALGAVLVFVIALFRRSITFPRLLKAIKDAVVTTSSLFFIVLGAALFTKFLAFSGVPNYLISLFESAEITPVTFMIICAAIFVLLGMFLEPIGVMLLTLPILLPICRSLDIDLVWFGVLVVKYIEIGVLTPPVGLHAFVVKSVVKDTVSLGTIFKGLMWFLAAEVVIMILLISFPQIALFLPSLMG